MRENWSMEFSTRSETNQAVQAQKMTIEIKNLDLESGGIVLSMQQKQRP